MTKLKSRREKSWIHLASLVLRFFTMLLWDAQHRIIGKIPDALLHLRRLPIENLNVCFDTNLLSEI